MSSGDLQVFIDSMACFLLLLDVSNHFFFQEPVNVLTCDGRVVVGILKGFDQAMNIILSHSHERIFSPNEPVSVVQLGLYLIRGDNVAIVGEIDEDKDSSIDYAAIRALPLPIIVH